MVYSLSNRELFVSRSYQLQRKWNASSLYFRYFSSLFLPALRTVSFSTATFPSTGIRRAINCLSTRCRYFSKTQRTNLWCQRTYTASLLSPITAFLTFNALEMEITWESSQVAKRQFSNLLNPLEGRLSPLRSDVPKVNFKPKLELHLETLIWRTLFAKRWDDLVRKYFSNFLIYKFLYAEPKSSRN